MILNPILMIVLAGISFIAGAASLNETDGLLSLVPFLVFAFLFCLSLLIPGVKKAPLPVYRRVALKHFRRWTKLGAARLTHLIKSTGEWLGALVHYGARYLAQKRFELSQTRRAKSIVDDGSFRQSPPPAPAP